MSKNKVTTENSISEDLKKQREFLKRLEDENFDFGIVVGKAFVRGMRDLGYKNNGTALDELIDNSIQSEASRVDIVFGYSARNTSQKKPDQIAIIDNGHGMDPLMIRIAAMWGGTHRENDRTGFGRYGYGLPSSCVSIGEKFTILSKIEGKDCYGLTIDIQEISDGRYTDDTGKIVIPEAKKQKFPDWVSGYINKQYKDYNNGTVIVIDKLDRLNYTTTKYLKEFLLQHFGVIYRNFLRKFSIYVDGKDVEPIDPLFVTPGYRFYDEDSERAISYAAVPVEVRDKETKEVKGNINIRYSSMPITFLRVPEDKKKVKGGKNNNRFKIRKDANGIIILRAGRQIDVINPKWTVFQNNDRYIGIEVDFPPVLDEEFSITTSKQQVVLKERIWDILEEAGVFNFIKAQRTEYKKQSAELKKLNEEEADEKKRLSEIAMEEAKKFDTKEDQLSVEQQKESEKNLKEEVRKRTRVTGETEEKAKQEIELLIKERPYFLEEEEMTGAPFYRVAQVGGQKKLFLNKSHRFYSDIYMSPTSTPALRYSLEVLLFVMGDCELSSSGDRKLFYETERQEWSKLLNVALDRLAQYEVESVA